MTRDEATLGILAGIIHSAIRTSTRAAEIQVDAEAFLVELRARGEAPATAADLARAVSLQRRLAILVQTHSSTVTAADGLPLPGIRRLLRERLRRIWRATTGRSP